MNRASVACTFLACLVALSAGTAQENWVSINGQITLDDEEETPIEGVLVWLVHDDVEELPIHPCMSLAEESPIQLNIVDGRLDAKSVMIVTNQELQITNRDDVGRGFVPITFGNESSSNIQPNRTQIYQFSNTEKIPGRLVDVMDPDNSIPLLIQEHPYMTATDSEGNFALCLMPSGRRKLRFWHPNRGWLKHLRSSSFTTNRRGIAETELASDIDDLKLKLKPNPPKSAK